MRCAAPTCFLFCVFVSIFFRAVFISSCFLLFLVWGVWVGGAAEVAKMQICGQRYRQLARHGSEAPAVGWACSGPLRAMAVRYSELLPGPQGCSGGQHMFPPGQSRWRPVCSCEGEGPCAVRLDVPDAGHAFSPVGAVGHAPVRHKWLLHPVPGTTPRCTACIVGGFRAGVGAAPDRLLCTPRPCSCPVAAAPAPAQAQQQQQQQQHQHQLTGVARWWGSCPRAGCMR